MSNQNQKVEKTEGQEQVQNVQVQAAEAPVQQAAPVEQPKQGFGTWFKKHWKAVVGTVAGAGAVVGSGVVAYKKGKAAGIMSVPVPQQEPDDYSLDPNR